MRFYKFNNSRNNLFCYYKSSNRRYFRKSRLCRAFFDKTENGDFFALFYGKIRHSSGKEDLLFKVKMSRNKIKGLDYFPVRLFAWGKNQVAYCGEDLKELILVDYKTKKEVYRNRMPEMIKYISANKQTGKFVIATEKRLYLLKSEYVPKNKIYTLKYKCLLACYWFRWNILY